MNDAPNAVDNSISTDEDTSVNVPVLGNDTDPDGDTLTVTGTTDGNNGTVTINANGKPVYTPNTNFHGIDSFTYDISDGNGGVDTATVTVTVNSINDAPNAVNNNVSTNQNTSVEVFALANDTDVDGDTLTVTGATNGSNGTVSINGSGNPVYSPNSNFSGIDSFTYDISDGNGGVDTATVTVTVNLVNTAPQANNDSATTDEDSPVVVSVLGNDNDPDGDTLTVTGATDGKQRNSLYQRQRKTGLHTERKFSRDRFIYLRHQRWKRRRRHRDGHGDRQFSERCSKCGR